MSDNTLSFSTRVDLSGLKSGMEEVKSSVASTASGAAQSVEQFSARAKAATEAYNAAAAGTVAQQKALGEAFDAAGRSGATYVEALEQAVAATASLNVAEQAETNTLKGSMSARMAASAEMRVLEGNTMGSTRAAAAFLTTIPGVGAALQVAFPIFGAVALGEVLADVGEKIYKVAHQATQAGQEIAQAFGEANQSARTANDELALTNSRLQDDIDKLEKHPSNGLQTALMDAVVAADHLQQSLNEDTKKVDELLKKNSVGFFGELFTNAVGTGTTETNISKTVKDVETSSQKLTVAYAQAMQEAGADQSKSLAARKSYFDGLATIQDNALSVLQPKLQSYYDMQRNSDKFQTGGDKVDYSANISELEGAIQQVQLTKARLGLMNQNETLEQKKGALTGDKQSGNPDEKRLRAIETTFAQESAIHKKSAGEAAAFWSEYVNTFKVGTEQYLEVLEKYNAASEANLNKGHLAKQLQEQQKAESHGGDDGDASAIEAGTRAVDAWRTKTSEDVLETGERWKQYHEEVARGAEAQEQAATSLALANIKIEEQQGGITGLSAAHQEAAIHAAEYAEKLRILKAQLDAIANDPNLDKAQKATQTQGVQNQITQVSGQAAATKATDNGAIAQQISQPYVKGIDTINNAWLGMQNKLIYGTKNISLQFANMGVSILESVAASFEKMVVKSAESELKMVIAHRVANQTKTQSDIQGAATADAVSASSALKRVAHEAAVAAAGAWAALSPIPIIGPVLGAVAAGVTYAGVLALAAFDVGGIIPGSGAVPIMGHGGERVLTPSQTSTFESFVQNMGNTSNSHSQSIGVHQTINGGGNGNAEFRRMLKANATHVAKTVQQGARAMGRA